MGNQGGSRIRGNPGRIQGQGTWADPGQGMGKQGGFRVSELGWIQGQRKMVDPELGIQGRCRAGEPGLNQDRAALKLRGT